MNVEPQWQQSHWLSHILLHYSLCAYCCFVDTALALTVDSTHQSPARHRATEQAPTLAVQAVGEAMLAELRAVAAAKPGGEPVSMALLGGRGAQVQPPPTAACLQAALGTVSSQHPSTAGCLHAALGTVSCVVIHCSWHCAFCRCSVTVACWLFTG